ncbi:MAG: insulinase family protein [Myxococcales bacterium]|nr:insulinase family protein [Myxococcales bacterium]
MKPIASALAALMLAGPLLTGPALADEADVPVPALDVETVTLANGLTVLLSRDDRLPVVAVEVRYLVGSGHEPKGRTGFAHLFEHLMFQGSQHFDDEYFKPFEPIGAAVNGTTNTDRTNYYQRVPREYLELALWMESDRMENLLPVLTQQKLDNQRDVVKNERRQSYEDRPYGMFWIWLLESLFPEGHPYHHSTIGSHEDLTAATLDDVKGFFAQYYTPANAMVTIVGDFDPAEAKALVQKYFGHLPAGTRAEAPKPAPVVLDKAKHRVQTDDVPLPRIYYAWPTPALYEDGDAALDILATLLTDGKSSRLYQPLVYEQKVAKDVAAFQVSMGRAGFFVVMATAAPGKSLDAVQKALDRALADAIAKPPTADEMTRALNGWRKSFYGRVESVLSRAQLLSNYAHLTGRADYLAEDLARYTGLDAAAIQAAAKKYLGENRVRLDIVPAPEGAAAGGKATGGAR